MNPFCVFISKIQLFTLEIPYRFHLFFRKGHDGLYENSKTYKKYSDKGTIGQIRKGTLLAFVVSFIVFYSLQYLAPVLLNPFKPNQVEASASNVLWSTTANFTTGQTPNVTNDGKIDIGSHTGDDGNGSIVLKSAFSYPTASDADVTISASVDIKALYENDVVTGVTTSRGVDKGLNKGVGTYNPDTNAVPHFNNLTITSSGILTATNLVKVNFTVNNNLQIDGKIDLTGKGYIHDQSGSGGFGSGGTSYFGTPTVYGGEGGGVVSLLAKNIVLNGKILTQGVNGYIHGFDHFGTGGGGGGSISINAETITEGSSSVINASGGNGDSCNFGTGGCYGGNGGNGGSISINGVITGSGTVTSNGGIGGAGIVWDSYDAEGCSYGDPGACDHNYTGGDGTTGTAGVTSVTANVYQTTGNLGTAGVGLRKDSGITKARWSTLKIKGNVPSGSGVKFQIRPSDTFGTGNFVNPLDGTQVNTWSSAVPVGNYASTAYTMTINSNVLTSKTLEVIVLVEGGTTTPRIDSIQLDYDGLEGISQYNMNITAGSGNFLYTPTGFYSNSPYGNSNLWTNETSVRVTYYGINCINCTVAPTNPRAEMEIKPINQAFAANPVSGVDTKIDSTLSGYVLFTGLTPSTSYHVRMRPIDDQGRVGPWTSYGIMTSDGSPPGTPAAVDVGVDQAAPVLSNVSINSGAAYISSTNVTVTISASDTGGSGLLFVRYSTDNVNWNSWESYAATKNWTLPSGEGQKTIYLQVKDTAGNVSNTLASQTVTLDTQVPTGSLTVKDAATGITGYAKSTSVKLVPSATDPGTSPSGVGFMHFSNDGVTWSAWEAYSTNEKAWTVPSGDGVKNVYVEYKDNGGNIGGNYVNTVNYTVPGTSDYAIPAGVDFVILDIKGGGSSPYYSLDESCTIYNPVPGGDSSVNYPYPGGTNLIAYGGQSNGAGGTNNPSGYISTAGAGGTGGVSDDSYCAPDPGYNGGRLQGNLAVTTGQILRATVGAGASHNGSGQNGSVSLRYGGIKGTITLDQDPPTTTGAVTGGTTGGNGWYNSNVTYTLTAADTASGVASTVYCTDTTGTCTPTTPYSSPIVLNTQSATNHIRFSSTDNSGNVQAVQDSGIIKLDMAVPSTSGNITAGTAGSNGWYTTNVTYTITPTDPTSGVASTVYCTDTAGSCTPSTPYSTPVIISTESAANHIRFKSTDNAGNVQPVQDSGAIKIDKATPTTTGAITAGTLGANGWYNSNVTFTLTNADVTSGVATTVYCTDTTGSCTPTTGYGSPITLSNESATNHIRWRSTDTAGLVQGIQDSGVIKIDKTNPVEAVNPFIVKSTTAVTYNTVLSGDTYYIYGNASDTGSGVATFNIDTSAVSTGQTSVVLSTSGGPWTVNGNTYAYRSPLLTADPSLSDGSKSLPMTTADNAGNSAVTYTGSIFNDSTPPTDVANVKAYQDSGKAHNITANNTANWYPYVNPYFEWDASTAGSGISTYKYCLSQDQNCTPSTPTPGNTANLIADLSSSTDGTYYLRVIAVSNVLLNSNPVTFQYNFDKTAPTAVTGFTAATSDTDPETQINLHWNSYPTTGRAPIQNYKIERVKYSEYQTNAWSIGSDWSSGGGFAVFTTTNITFIDSTDPAAPGINLQGQTPLDPSTRYIYRISAKDTSNPGYGVYQANIVTALTKDVAAPDPIPAVTSIVACTTSANPCSANDPVNGGANTPGFSTKISFTGSDDIGSGMGGYRIYRSVTDDGNASGWTLVGFLPYQAGQQTVWYDNDANNDSTYSGQKAATSPRLNDHTTYYYRVTAVDAAAEPNETEIIPADVNHALDNWGLAITPDVTAPSVPTSVIANAQGLDHTNDHQMINVSWSASQDFKAKSTDVVPGTITYHVYRATSADGPWDNLVKTTTALNFDDEGLTALTTYYYRVSAYDSIPNESALSAITGTSNTTTYSSEVPGVPTNISVVSKKGDPNTDHQVGHTITISFNGSMSNVSDITKYEIWRATTNNSGGCNQGENSSACWLRVNGAVKLQDLSITPTPDDRGTVHSVSDGNLNDATTYYYKVRAQDNSVVPGHPEQSNLYSGFTAITSAVNIGWDVTPDATAPRTVTGITIKDIHGDGENYLRNIISWERTADPARNGLNDFKHYKIYRSTDGLVWTEIMKDNGHGEMVCPLNDPVQDVAMANNYYIDLIPQAEAQQMKDGGKSYYYYVTAEDDANTNFRYQNGGVVINPYANESDKSAIVSLNPLVAQPSINTVVSGGFAGKKAELLSVGVSSATIHWTTDQPADSLVEYTPRGSGEHVITVGDRTPTNNHTVQLFDLKPGTTYDYNLISRNYLANEAIVPLVKDQANQTVRDNLLPVLTTDKFSITPGKVTETTSTIQIDWATNKDAKSNTVEWEIADGTHNELQRGISGQLADTESSYDLRNHSVVVKGMKSDTKYRYKIRSISTDGFTDVFPADPNEYLYFTTRSFDQKQFTLAPSSSNVAERNITSTTAQIVWQTESPTSSWVDYGKVSGVYDNSAGNDDMSKQHAVQLVGLIPGTKYYYKVRVKDENDITYTSQEYMFIAVLKPKISNFTVSEVKPYEFTVTWETNVDTETIINFGKTPAYGEKKGKSEMTKNHSLTIKDLEDNTEYHFQILAHDEAGNEVADQDRIVRTPVDTQGPRIADVKTDILPMGASDAAASVVISWNTDKPASTLVEYDEGIIAGKYNNASVEDKTLNLSHTVIIKDLKPASSYHYRIVTKDKRGNTTLSQDYTFVTPTQEKSILQLILKSLEDTFAWTNHINLFMGNVGKRLLGK